MKLLTYQRQEIVHADIAQVLLAKSAGLRSSFRSVRVCVR